MVYDDRSDIRCSIRQRFGLRPSTPLRKLFQAFCSHFSIDIADGTFMLDGDRLYSDNTDTPEALGLGHGDVIDWMFHQTGD